MAKLVHSRHSEPVLPPSHKRSHPDCRTVAEGVEGTVIFNPLDLLVTALVGRGNHRSITFLFPLFPESEACCLSFRRLFATASENMTLFFPEICLETFPGSLLSQLNSEQRLFIASGNVSVSSNIIASGNCVIASGSLCVSLLPTLVCRLSVSSPSVSPLDVSLFH